MVTHATSHWAITKDTRTRLGFLNLAETGLPGSLIRRVRDDARCRLGLEIFRLNVWLLPTGVGASYGSAWFCGLLAWSEGSWDLFYTHEGLMVHSAPTSSRSTRENGVGHHGVTHASCALPRICAVWTGTISLSNERRLGTGGSKCM